MAAGQRFRDDVHSFGFLHDPEGRARRGRRIVALLSKFHHDDLRMLRVLDVGCSAGLITQEVARHASYTVGVDPDILAMHHATTRLAQSGRLVFAVAAGEALPFADETFDVVLCNHVYEHAMDPHAMMREIARVLRAGGVCWFAGGHTWQLVEPHFRLPLLSLLPRALASWLVRASGRGEEYAIRFLPPWQLRTLFAPFARAQAVSAEVLRDPVTYAIDDGLLRYAVVRELTSRMAPLLAALSPTQLWLLWRG